MTQKNLDLEANCPSNIDQIISIKEYQDVKLMTYGCQENKHILGGDSKEFAFVNNQPINNKGIWDLCHQSYQTYYQWKLLCDNDQKYLNLDLCQECNSPQKIWYCLNKSETWVDYFWNLFRPKNHMTDIGIFFIEYNSYRCLRDDQDIELF